MFAWTSIACSQRGPLIRYHNHIKLNQSGFYLQDKFMLPTTHGTLSATAGVRLEFQNQRFAASPCLNTMWTFDNGLSFNAAYGILSSLR